jgi:glycosyltransferase involved in cell wall biosynthesis
VKLALFFTRAVSLRTWLDSGLLSREQAIYARMLDDGVLSSMLWLTYGAGDSELANELHRDGRLHPGIQVCPMPRWLDSRWGVWLYSFVLGWTWRRALAGCDLLKTNQLDGGWGAVLAGRILGKPVLARSGYVASTFIVGQDMRARWRRLVLQKLEAFVCRHAAAVMVTSLHDRAYAVQTLGVVAAKVALVRNFVDTTLFSPGKAEAGGASRVIHVGRLSPQKNLAALIEAAAMVGVGLDLYGVGEQRELLESVAHQWRADVRFLGRVPHEQLPDIIGRYRVGALVSFYEGLPKSLLEFMACGLVCVGTPVRGIDELLRHGENGLVADNTSAQAIAATLSLACGDTASGIGMAARAFMLREFSIDAVMASELGQYRKLGVIDHA